MFEVRKVAITHEVIAKNSHFLAPVLESAQRDGFQRRRFTKHFLADVLREADLEILYSYNMFFLGVLDRTSRGQAGDARKHTTSL